MRTAVLRNGKVTVRRIADPVPGPGQVLVRPLACAVCASDLHYMDHPEAGADDDSGCSVAKRAQLRPEDVPLVIGCGAIALSAIATLKRLGAGPIVAADFVASRRATALATGGPRCSTPSPPRSGPHTASRCGPSSPISPRRRSELDVRSRGSAGPAAIRHAHPARGGPANEPPCPGYQ